MVGITKQILDHAMAPTAAGGFGDYAIERMLVLTSIAIMQKAVSA
jgi:hypothetical protein